MSDTISTITPVDVARAAGIDPNTARRYLNGKLPPLWERTRRKLPAEKLPDLVALCQSKQQRRCRNKFNSIPIDTDGSISIQGASQ